MPSVLYVAGKCNLLAKLNDDPAVAIVGTRRATDYGREIARSVGYELASAGLTIISGLAEGIPASAHEGALEAGGATITVMASGVETCQPASSRSLYEAILERGCAIAEIPGGRARRWCFPARNRIVAGLAAIVVVVEAEDTPADMAAAQYARLLKTKVVAVPGRVTSPASIGTHALIADGVPLVRNGTDVLDILFESREQDRCDHGGARANDAEEADIPRAERMRAEPGVTDSDKRAERALAQQHKRPSTNLTAAETLAPELRVVLDRVSRGADTIQDLMSTGLGFDETLARLTQLELQGRIVPGSGGRYVVRPPLVRHDDRQA